MAYHLAARGCRDVLVVERGQSPAPGSTGRATGGFRSQFATAVNVRLSLLSRAKLLGFSDEHGVDPGYSPRGYLFLAGDQAQMAALLAAQRVQHDEGLAEARAVSAEEALRLNPALDCEGIRGGTFCPTDGFIRPLEILRGYTASAERLGVSFERGVGVEGFRKGAGGRVESVLTTAGEIAAGSVVNAAGAWAGRLAASAGVALPVVPLKRQVAVTRPFSRLTEEMPMTIFVGDGFHLRVRDGRVLLLWPDEREDRGSFSIEVEDEWVASVLGKARARLPCLAGAEVERELCWAGLYEMSPDKHAILGRASGVENFYLANGSSGHGVMHSPALGQLLAEIILDGEAHSLDARPLRPERFEEGAPNVAHDFL